MAFKAVFWSILAVVVMLFIPIMLIWSMVEHMRSKGRDRRGGGGISAGIGAAMQELDRIMTRPSIEHQIETEHQTLKREDDAGSD